MLRVNNIKSLDEIIAQIKEDSFPFIIGLFVVAAILLCVATAQGQEMPANSIVALARAEIGHGEQGRDNCGKDIRRYLRGAQGQPWCGGFVSYVLKKARDREFPYYYSAISYYKTAKDKGMLVSHPRPGDLIVFWRIRRSPLVHGHIGIVEKVEYGKITTIEGNTGRYPSKVRRITYKEKPRQLLAYIRLREEQRE